jgi:hypothetical protein
VYEPDHSTPSTARVTNECSSTSAAPICLHDMHRVDSMCTLFLILLSLLAHKLEAGIWQVPVICLRRWDGLAFSTVCTNMFPVLCLIAVPTQITAFKCFLALQIRNKTERDTAKHKMFPNMNHLIKLYDKHWIFPCAMYVCLRKHENGILITWEGSMSTYIYWRVNESGLYSTHIQVHAVCMSLVFLWK